MKHIDTPLKIDSFNPSLVSILDRDGAPIATGVSMEYAEDIVHAVNTIEALEKSHAELLTNFQGIRDNPIFYGDRAFKVAEAAIANAQPVVTMLSNQGGSQE